MYKFATAWEQENVMFDSAKPKHSEVDVSQWVAFMQNQGKSPWKVIEEFNLILNDFRLGKD
jgi:hypothetical protein